MVKPMFQGLRAGTTVSPKIAEPIVKPTLRLFNTTNQSASRIFNNIVESEDARRGCLHLILTSHVFEAILVTVVAANCAFVIRETDARASGQEVDPWIHLANLIFVSFYVVETSCRLYIYRLEFFFDSLRVCDLAVVTFDVFNIFLEHIYDEESPMPFLSLLRLLRGVRLLKVVRVSNIFPELHLMMKSLIYAAHSMFWGVLLLGVAMTFCSTVAVHVIHPLNLEMVELGLHDGCDRCPRAFASVFQSNLTFLQTLIAGDSWGEVTIPIMERHPWTGVYFLFVLVIIDLGILNLILAIIVDRSQDARMETFAEAARIKETERHKAAKHFIQLCTRLDKDKNGVLTKDELLHGYDEDENFRQVMDIMDVGKEEIDIMFQVLDTDKSNSVDYKEFAIELQKIRSHDAHTLLVFIKFYVAEIWHKLREQIVELQTEVHVELENMRQSVTVGDFRSQHKQSGIDKVSHEYLGGGSSKADTRSSASSFSRLALESPATLNVHITDKYLGECSKRTTVEGLANLSPDGRPRYDHDHSMGEESRQSSDVQSHESSKARLPVADRGDILAGACGRCPPVGVVAPILRGEPVAIKDPMPADDGPVLRCP